MKHNRLNVSEEDELQEADQLVVKVGAEKRASIKIGGSFVLDRFQIFLIMPETCSLANRRFVVDSLYSSDEGIIELGCLYYYPEPRGFFDGASDVVLHLVFQPVGVGGNRYGSEV